MTTTKEEVKPQRDWNTHVYDPEGKWVGFFLDDTTAKNWVKKRPGFEISNRPPEREVVEYPEVTEPEPDSSDSL